MKKVSLAVIALTLVALSIILYKRFTLGFPVTKKDTQFHWIVEANLQFRGNDRAVTVNMNLPRSGYHYFLLDENFGSQGYGRTTHESLPNRRSEWSVRKAQGPQNIFYRAIILVPAGDSQLIEPVGINDSTKPYPVDIASLDREILTSVIKEAFDKSGDQKAFMRMIFSILHDRVQLGEIPRIIGTKKQKPDFLRLAIDTLNLAKLPARPVHGFYLADKLSNISYDSMIEVQLGDHWHIVDLGGNFVTAKAGFVPWWRGDEPLYVGRGANGFISSVSVKKLEEVSLYQVLKVGAKTNSIFSSVSIFNLPLATQATFEILLLLPIGGLVLIVMRNLIGFKLPGTFLPVLIALSFRHTSLTWGLFAFVLISICGFSIRAVIEHFQVLLLSRVSAILTSVVISIYLLSIGAFYIDANLVNAMSPFPLVVISGLIERISVVWDESGTKEALKQWLLAIFGSILVYSLIIREDLTYFLMVYPETLLIVIAAILLLGRYTGYRLFELFRFKSIAAN